MTGIANMIVNADGFGSIWRCFNVAWEGWWSSVGCCFLLDPLHHLLVLSWCYLGMSLDLMSDVVDRHP